jgi:thiol-disulfide isomerase/thioredoxin
MQPPVHILTPDSFDALVRHKSANEIWMIDYYAPWCGPCQQLAPEWRRLAKVVDVIYALLSRCAHNRSSRHLFTVPTLFLAVQQRLCSVFRSCGE